MSRDSFFFFGGAVGLLLGIGLGLLVAVPDVAWWGLGLLVVAGFVGWWGVGAGEAKPAGFRLAGPAAILLLFFTLGLARVEYFTVEPFLIENTTVTFEGIVVREPELRERTVHLYIETDFIDHLVLAYAPLHSSVAYGDRVSITGTLASPAAFETDLGRTFDYRSYLLARDVGYVVYRPTVTVLENTDRNALVTALLQFKHSFMESLERVLPEPAAGLGEGILLGVKRALGPELEEAFRRTGIIHIVVLSGFNVMIVAEAIMRLLAFMRPRPRLVVGLFAITSFALMVGLTATVVRASIMAAIVLVARATGNTNAPLRALFFAGGAMLLVTPELLLYDPGFQLSFLATFSLIVVAPLVERGFRFVPSLFQVREFLVATVTTQLFLTPLLLFSIGQVSLVSVLVNVLVLPVVPLAMLVTFITGVVGFVSSSLALVVGYVAFGILSYIILVAEWFASVPYAAITIPAFSIWWVVGVYAALGVALIWYYWRFSDELDKNDSI